jgi:hypothetical protein
MTLPQFTTFSDQHFILNTDRHNATLERNILFS